MVLTLFVICLTLLGCANSPDIAVTGGAHVYGFWGGLWHGIIIPFSVLGQWLFEGIAVYAVSNNGGWYDFGFLLGAAPFWVNGFIRLICFILMGVFINE